jgi:hypothetical protein
VIVCDTEHESSSLKVMSEAVLLNILSSVSKILFKMFTQEMGNGLGCLNVKARLRELGLDESGTYDSKY